MKEEEESWKCIHTHKGGGGFTVQTDSFQSQKEKSGLVDTFSYSVIEIYLGYLNVSQVGRRYSCTG